MKIPKHVRTAAELQAFLQQDKEYKDREQQQLTEAEAQAAARKVEVEGLEAELRAANIRVDSFEDMNRKPDNFKAGFPIILRHLECGEYSDLTKRDMAFVFATKDANEYWNKLTALYESTRSSKTSPLFMEGLAQALAASYREPEIEKLIELSKDRRNGPTRMMLVYGLKRSRKIDVTELLIELADDPEIGKQVEEWLRERKISRP